MSAQWEPPAVFAGRGDRATIQLSYTGGGIPADRREALENEVRNLAAGVLDRISVSFSEDLYTAVTLSASIRAASPLKALVRMDTLLDDALMATGLFENFDVTGKTLGVAPL